MDEAGRAVREKWCVLVYEERSNAYFHRTVLFIMEEGMTRQNGFFFICFYVAVCCLLHAQAIKNSLYRANPIRGPFWNVKICFVSVTH